MFKWFKKKVNNVVKVPMLSEDNLNTLDNFMDKYQNYRLGGPVAFMYYPKPSVAKEPGKVVILASYKYEKYGHYNN